MTEPDLPGAEPSTPAVVVVHYRSEDTLRRTLECVVDGTPGWRRVVVSNGTVDRGLLVRLTDAAGAELIELDNPGYAAAVNAGVRACIDNDVLLVLTHEVRFAPSLPSALARVLSRDASVGLVGPLLRDGDPAGAVWSSGGQIRGRRRIPGNVKTLPRQWPVDREWLDGSCFALRRSDWARLRGLEERYFLYLEDVDLGLRVTRDLGLRVVCDGRVEAYQSPGDAFSTFLAVRNVLLLHARFYPWLIVWDYVENVTRMLVLGWMRPRGAAGRARHRLRALVTWRRGVWSAADSDLTANR